MGQAGRRGPVCRRRRGLIEHTYENSRESDSRSSMGDGNMQPSNRNIHEAGTAWRRARAALVVAICAAPWWQLASAADAPAAAAAPAQSAQSGVDPEQVATFIKAARFGQDQAVKLYLDHDLPINVTSNFGDTALIAAAGGGQREIVETLLAKGADVNIRNREGRTALMAAAQNGDAKIVGLLIEHGADVEAKDKQGETALFDAVRYGRLAAVQRLLEAGAKPNVANQRATAAPDNGYTPLMYAVRRGIPGNSASARDWTEMVQALLEKGADANQRDARGVTALSIAQDAGNPDAVKLLLAGGAKEIYTYKGMNLDDALILAASNGDAVKVRESLAAGADPHTASRAGVTPLLAAAYGGNADAVKALVEAGAHVNEVPNGFRAWTWTGAKLPISRQPLAQAASVGDTALIIAARLGHAAVVDYLLGHGADPKLANPHTDTPLSVAAEQGHAKIVALILAKGVDPDEGRQSIPSFSGRAMVGRKNEDHNTPLIKAAQGGHNDAVRVLLEAKADSNIRGFAGKTALYWAVERGYADVVALLLERHADPDVKSDAGLSPLMEAAKNGRVDIVKALIASNAAVDAREGGDILPGTLDTSGAAAMTALMFAAIGGHAEVVQALLDAGADVSIRNNNGQTALEEAQKSGHADIVAVLRSVSVAGK